jgi:hypothetical protein
MKANLWFRAACLVAALLLSSPPDRADTDVYLTEVPDYDWQFGCFGTATGNLIGYWDRHGFPDFYVGPTSGGVAPLKNYGTNAGIRSLWASQGGFDGRPTSAYGHVEDYYYDYASTTPDRFISSNRTEHVADCIGDFIGLNQKRWTNMNNECDGNIDGYVFVYWETNGSRRANFIPPAQGTNAGKDLPSGLRAWTQHRGYEAESFSQLSVLNAKCPPGQGFSFADVVAEIDAGYPLLVFLQNPNANSRSLSGMPRANPLIHGMLIIGYQVYDGFGTNVYVRDSWGGGLQTRNWSSASWVGGTSLPVRGMIGYRPRPRIRKLTVNGGTVTLAWDGPSSEVYDVITGVTAPVHAYQIEWSPTLAPADFQPVGPSTYDRTLTVPDPGSPGYFRVRLLP